MEETDVLLEMLTESATYLDDEIEILESVRAMVRKAIAIRKSRRGGAASVPGMPTLGFSCFEVGPRCWGCVRSGQEGPGFPGSRSTIREW